MAWMKSNAFTWLMIVACLTLPPAWGAAGQDVSAESQPTDEPTSAPITMPTTAPAASEDDAVSLRLLLPLLAVGTVLLIGWCVRRVQSPGPLYLADAPPRPNRLSSWHVLGVFIAFVLLQPILGLTMQLTGLPVRDNVTMQTLAAMLSQVGWLAAALFVAGRTFPFGLRGLGLDARHWPADAGRAVFTLLAVLPVVIVTLIASTLLVQWAVQQGLLKEEDVRLNVMLERLRTVNALGKTMIVISAVVLAPLAEEIFFRGLLQSMLRNVMKPWPAILVASGLFALVHFSAIRDVIPLLPLSVVLGYTYERTGRLITPILIHALFNAVMLATFLAG